MPTTMYLSPLQILISPAVLCNLFREDHIFIILVHLKQPKQGQLAQRTDGVYFSLSFRMASVRPSFMLCFKTSTNLCTKKSSLISFGNRECSNILRNSRVGFDLLGLPRTTKRGLPHLCHAGGGVGPDGRSQGCGAGLCDWHPSGARVEMLVASHFLILNRVHRLVC